MNLKLGRRATAVSLLLLIATPLHAQWWEKMPRGADSARRPTASPDLTVPAPRRPDGKPASLRHLGNRTVIVICVTSRRT